MDATGSEGADSGSAVSDGCSAVVEGGSGGSDGGPVGLQVCGAGPEDGAEGSDDGAGGSEDCVEGPEDCVERSTSFSEGTDGWSDESAGCAVTLDSFSDEFPDSDGSFSGSDSWTQTRTISGCLLVRSHELEVLQFLAARRVQHDLMFMRKIQNQSVDSSFLLECFPLTVPTRTLRKRLLFHVPHGRVNTVKSGMFCRPPRSCNAFLDACRDVDVWVSSAGQYKTSVIAYVSSLSV